MYRIISKRLEIQGNKPNPVYLPHVYSLPNDPDQVPEQYLRNKLTELMSLGHEIISVTWREENQVPVPHPSQQYIDAFQHSG